MQHPDEGTIHAWLDGALRPDEAARVEAHVAECAECAARVAEARGFVAASSRILSALDNVPRGVVPSAPSRPILSRSFLRAAAMLFVVAAGGLLVVRMRPSASSRVSTVEKSTERLAATDTAKNVAAPTRAVAAAKPSQTVAVAAAARTSISKKSGSPGVAAVAAAPLLMANALAAKESPRERLPETTTDIALARERNQPQTVVVTGIAISTEQPLKVLKSGITERGTRTIYEVAPNRIAVLIETDSIGARSLITSETPQEAMAAIRYRDQSRVGSASSTSAMMERSARASLAPLPTNTIEWTDESTGRIFILSGPFSVSELTAIKQRIAQMRSGR
jgi:hypothetical protein